MGAYVRSECGRGRSVPSYVTACCALQTLVEAAAPSGVLKPNKGKAETRSQEALHGGLKCSKTRENKREKKSLTKGNMG